MRRNSLLPPQREASAHPRMTNLVVISVLHADALDEFPKHRQELLASGKRVGSLQAMRHPENQARALKL